MNEHFTIDFADAVVIKESVGNIKIGNIATGKSNVIVRHDSDGMLILDFTLEKGDKGDKGDTGPSGYNPVRGTDYWTEADKNMIISDVLASLPNASGVSF